MIQSLPASHPLLSQIQSVLLMETQLSAGSGNSPSLATEQMHQISSLFNRVVTGICKLRAHRTVLALSLSE